MTLSRNGESGRHGWVARRDQETEDGLKVQEKEQ